MKRINRLVILLVPLLAVATLRGDEKQSPLGKEMEAMNRGYRKLKREYADPAQKDASLELVAAMRKNVEAAKTLTPPEIEKVPEAGKAKYRDTYQKQLDELDKKLVLLSTAIGAGNTDAAKAEIEKISELRDTSHKELGVDDDK